MNQQLRILAAAAQLGHFTAYDLAAVTGVSANTVRSVLRRHQQLFSVQPAAGTRRSRGRPTNSYFVVDPDGVGRQLAEVRESLDWATMPTLDATDAERALARVEVAENSLRRALETEISGDRLELVAAALEAADVVLSDGEIPEEVTHRALRVKAAGQTFGVEYSEPRNQFAALSAAAVAIAAVVGHSPMTALVLLRTLMQVTQQLHQAPPVGIIAHAEIKAENILAPNAVTEWVHCAIEGSDDYLWSPEWSAPLAAHSALAGVVLRVDDADDVDVGAALARLRDWTPRIVMGQSDPELMTEAAKEGAMFLPFTGFDITQPAVSGISAALDQRIATFEAHDDSTLWEIVAASHHGVVGFSSERVPPEPTMAIEEAKLIKEPLTIHYPTSRR